MLGPASVRWNDYVGTAAADDADALTSTRSLYSLAGLDRERWTILGVDLSILEANPQVTIYGVDRQALELESEGDIEELGRRRGSIPVTAFQLDGETRVAAFLGDAFKRVAVRLIARGVREERLSVEAEQRVALD